jgi:GT2 family glycosyltransferase
MTLSIVIVSYNAREELANCLRSLAAAPPAIPHDITVVDNASSDGSADAVREGWPRVQVIKLVKNLGFSAGNNVGIRATFGELILLLNSDTIVPPGAIDRLVDRLRAHDDAAVAGPRLVDGTGRLEISFGPMISPFGELRQKLRGRLYERRVGLVERLVARAAGSERYVDWVSGACLLVYRSNAEAAGLLDERFFLYTEDVDFCASIRKRGRRILFTPAAEVVHLRGRSGAFVPTSRNAAYRRSHVAFYEKHHPRWAVVLRAYLRLRGQGGGLAP